MKAQFPDYSLPHFVIVDDCDDDTFLLRHRLREGGLTNPILSFHTPDEALSYLHAATAIGKKPAFIFTDIKMPAGCGLEFISRIRENPEWDEIRVVVITSSNQPADLQAALARRVDGYLIKFPVAEILSEFVQHGPWFPIARREAMLAAALWA
jgi:CheY-like chemotaxis protein